MTDAECGQVRPTSRRWNAVPAGFKIIGAYKLFTAALSFALGVGLFRLFRGDVQTGIQELIRALRLDPDNQLIHAAVEALTRIDRRRLEWIQMGVFAYSALHVAEGIGILRGKRWGAILIILATSSLIPIECFQIVRKPSPVRIAALVGNTAIVVYLIRNRDRLHRGFAANRAESGP
jgi:uncharacterized membrane protein (DUF2068 family)